MFLVFHVKNIEILMRLKNEILMLKFYLKQDNVAPSPHNIILFELDFNAKLSLLHLLQFLSDLKSTYL